MEELVTWLICIGIVIFLPVIWIKTLKKISAKLDRKIGEEIFQKSLKIADMVIFVLSILAILSSFSRKKYKI